MALRYLDSFDTYTTLLQRFTAGGGTIAAAAARTGIAGLRDPGAASVAEASLTIDAQGTWIIGVAFRTSGFPGADTFILGNKDAGAFQGGLALRADGTLRLYRGGGTLLATSALSMLANTYYYVEFKHIIANAGGTMEVRVNGAVWATFAGDTQETANATANQIYLAGTASTDDFDDLYVLDGTGAAPNNDYWGTTQIEAIVPSGAGNYTEFTTLVGAATHWQAVNEIPPNEDTSYVEAGVINQRDTFAFGNLTPTSATINGIQVSMRARATLAGALNIARMYRSGVTDNQGADVALTTSYVSILEIMATDPIAVAAWAVGAINGAEFGARSR
jgi:hypothetical protein